MAPRHVALYSLGSAANEQFLRQAAELCASAGAELSLVLLIVDEAVPDGCCGIQGAHWRRLIDEDTRDAAQRAAQLLEGAGCSPANVAVEVGPSLADIAARTADRFGCDVIAIGRKRRPWSNAGASRRQINQLRAACSPHIVELVPGRRYGALQTCA
jgi:nucleotide-binding universal stress UspA family protein